jgi:ribosomal protein S18 acetylase RimI-like enzyme
LVDPQIHSSRFEQEASRPNPSVKGTSCAYAQAAPYVERWAAQGDAVSQVEFRQATQQDIAYLTQLRLRTIHEHIRSAGIDLSYEEHELRARTRLEYCSILNMDGRTVGMIKVVRSAESWTIEQLQVEPEFQGNGIGAAVVRKVQNEAKTAGVKLLLGVLSANPALRLYRRLGFDVISEANGIVELHSVA